ncbi:uncharacterized protein BT62DRAFT_1080501 [Guyanagaster necrorhizus]|uniref:Pyridoxine 5'-phosphate oxidase dimerisation C-terminal domain-containing protein n=1 Tax=Guyanagaster necrorhizus TaxID=856835 RepID=A0A9P7VGY1_9AGAR|nr:uncharacterized protein BT62DRAFT_1080501 [Guyanagaster necrorhizus MCA 3950]KAG7440818.1 hypothetical protein BT62DRAFT_1080501 [Guyanagaster necrorhizus MCA 3950]
MVASYTCTLVQAYCWDVGKRQPGINAYHDHPSVFKRPLVVPSYDHRQTFILSLEVPQRALCRTLKPRSPFPYKVSARLEGKEVEMSGFWGSLARNPRMEFWSGKSSRLHDRIRYVRPEDGKWRVDLFGALDSRLVVTARALYPILISSFFVGRRGGARTLVFTSDHRCALLSIQPIPYWR